MVGGECGVGVRGEGRTGRENRRERGKSNVRGETDVRKRIYKNTEAKNHLKGKKEENNLRYKQPTWD